MRNSERNPDFVHPQNKKKKSNYKESLSSSQSSPIKKKNYLNRKVTVISVEDDSQDYVS